MKVFSTLALLAAAIQCVVTSTSARKLLRSGAGYDFAGLPGGKGDSTATPQLPTIAGVPGLDGLNGVNSITKMVPGGADGATKLLPSGVPSTDSITNGVGGANSVTDKLPVSGVIDKLPVSGVVDKLPIGGVPSVTDKLPVGGGKPGKGASGVTDELLPSTSGTKQGY